MGLLAKLAGLLRLDKLLSLEKALGFALQAGLLKKPLELAAKGVKGLEGYKTQISSGLLVLLTLVELTGVIPPGSSSLLQAALLGAAGVSFADKFKRVLPLAQKAAEAVQKEANKEP